MDNFVGKRLDGRYEIQEIIGVGGMAVVYKAYDNIDDRIVAVKILKEEFLANEEFRRRFKNESKAIAVLSHPNIVKVFDVSFGDKLQYIVMEFIDGIALKEYIEQQGSIKYREAVHFCSQILRALQHAHDKGIVHRDIKPQNIMLLQNGTIKVTDFGIARFSRSETRTMTDRAIGSVHYISPEQARGEKTDEKSDVYSVGVMMYEMLTGELPFQSDSVVSVALMQLQADPKLPREVNPSIPVGLEQIVMHAMQKEPNARYQSAAEMLKDIEDFRRNPEIQFPYTFFVDKNPTRYFANQQQPEDTQPLRAPVRVHTNGAAEASAEAEEPRKSKIIPYLTGIAIAFVIVLVILIIILAAFSDVFKPQDTSNLKTPSLVGKVYSEVIGDLNIQKNYTITKEPDEFNSEYEVGKIIRQDPEADTAIKKGATIKVVVSKGVETATIPSVKNKDLTTAKNELVQAGFKVEEEFRTDEDIEENIVIETDPKEGESIPKGDTVTLIVSKGKFNNPVIVPNFNGMHLDQAKAKIAELKLKLGDVEKMDDISPEGTVLSQSPLFNQEVDEGDEVILTVSTGIAPSKSVKLLYTVPLSGDINSTDTGRMQVFVNNKEVVSSTVRLNGSTTPVEIMGNEKNAEVVITVDNKEVYRCNLNFTTGATSNVSSTSWVKVPDVEDLIESQAVQYLSNYGLKADVKYGSSQNISPGRVYMQSNKAEYVVRNSTVTLYVVAPQVTTVYTPETTLPPVMPADNLG